MTDLDLLVFGCAVSFIAAAGVYVYVRESFVGRDARRVPVPVRARRVDPGRARSRTRRAA